MAAVWEEEYSDRLLAVVTLYNLGRALKDTKVGILAAALAITSPSLWFYGEVALPYVVEAFFSAFIALCCWKMLKGAEKYLWYSVFALSVAGGMRQNTPVFLFPLWLYSVIKASASFRKTIALIALLAVCMSLWFLPMVHLTGGWNAYFGALEELRSFQLTNRMSFFENGWLTLQQNAWTLFIFAYLGAFMGFPIMGGAAYLYFRTSNIRIRDTNWFKISFFLLWILPSICFYLFIYIHPRNYGYSLIFLPPLFILTAVLIAYLASKCPAFGKPVMNPIHLITLVLLVVNTILFLYSAYPVGRRELRRHERNLEAMFSSIKTYSPEDTVIFAWPYLGYSYRHIMYYLPEYRVYEVDCRSNRSGEARRVMWADNGCTFFSARILLPAKFRTFVAPFFGDDRSEIPKLNGIETTVFSSDGCLVSGPLPLLSSVYPQLTRCLP